MPVSVDSRCTSTITIFAWHAASMELVWTPRRPAGEHQCETQEPATRLERAPVSHCSGVPASGGGAQLEVSCFPPNGGKYHGSKHSHFAMHPTGLV